MTAFEVVILGTIQGLTEFLPVSSSGHLVVARLLFGFSEEAAGPLDAFLHLGTLLAVLFYFWRTWWALAGSVVVRSSAARAQRGLFAQLVVATVPAAAVGFLLQDAANGVLRQPAVVAAGFVVTAGALLAVQLLGRRNAALSDNTVALAGRMSYVDAVLIGVMQAVALVPGISRSGMTIAGGQARGLTRREAAVFSFLLSAPIIAGAGLVSVPLLAASVLPPSYLLLGLVVSFLSGLAAIRLLLQLIERVAFWPFIVYLVFLAGVVGYTQ